MHECLRCGAVCETELFCECCQSSLLQRSQQDGRTLFSSHVPQVQITELSPFRYTMPGPTVAEPVVRMGDEKEGPNLQEDELEWTSVELRKARPSSQALQANCPPISIPAQATQTMLMRRTRRVYLRRIFIVLALLAVIALVIDCVLVSLVFTRRKGSEQIAQPMLTFSPGVVYPGQLARLQLQHFSPLAHVLLRRNLDEQVRLDSSAPLLQVDANGNADVHVLVEDSWGTGNHSIEAEDIEAHYVASVAVQVIGAAPTRPAHFQLNQEAINLGADWQGANTLQPVTLQNTGSGRITWTAWSNQPWLMLTPTQGTFSESQRIVIGACRDRLRAGNYEGVVTFVSNTGTNIPLRVSMTVLPTKADALAMLVVTPPVLSFIATDGGLNPQEQTLTVSNPGSRPLYWSFDHSAPTVSVDQQVPLVEKMNWLEISPRSGTLNPGATTSIHLRVHSNTLLPGVYSGVLTFNGGQNALNNPQSVALSLVVQPRCGITANAGALSFTAIAGQQTPAQTLVLSMASACSGNLSWHATSLAKWLTMTPTSGKVNAQAGSLATVQVKSADLSPGTYTSFLVFLSERRTQTVAVQLVVLPPGQSQLSPNKGDTGDATATGTAVSADSHDSSSLAEPALALSALNLMFRIMQGETNSPAQSVSVANTSGGLLYWQARVDAAAQPWLKLSSTTGTISAGQTRELLFNVDGSALEPGTYRSSVVVSATDGAGVQVNGSPQILVVTLKVMQPCTLRVTPNSLSFSSSLLSSEPAEQNISVQGVGDCSYPLRWKASVDASSQSWLHLSAASGQDLGSGTGLSVRVSSNGTLLGFNSGQITFSASDSLGTPLRNSSQTVNVTFTVLG
jgi:hypothetical protein